MKPWKLTDLPPHVVARIRQSDREALGIERKQANAGLDAIQTGKDKAGRVNAVKTRRTPNKTETRYKLEVIDRAGGLLPTFEAMSFRMANGHRYTVDWCYRLNGRIVFAEVKGAHRYHSHQRARLAFDQCRVDWPEFVWVWATWTGEEWKIENYG
jgi:hypothetical protein